jgi:uncharacterized FlaG/YvyC family protein
MKVNAMTTQVQKIELTNVATRDAQLEENSAAQSTESPAPSIKIENNNDLHNLDIHYDDEVNLIQSLLKEQFTEEIIRKMPSDEYLSLLKLVNNFVNDLIDKKI